MRLFTPVIFKYNGTISKICVKKSSKKCVQTMWDRNQIHVLVNVTQHELCH